MKSKEQTALNLILDQLSQDLETTIDNIDRSIDIRKLDDYLAPIEDKIFKEIVQEIINQTQYISFQTFIREIRSIAEKIDINKLSIYLDIYDPCHSEFWCLIIIWPIIKEKVVTIFTEIDQITNEYPILFVDDCIYSGHRIGDLIRTINNTIPDEIHIYICVPYSTSAILTVIPGQIRGDYRLSQYAVQTDMTKLSLTALCGNFIEPLSIMYGNKVKLENNIEIWQYLDQFFDNSPCCLPIYFDHKIAENRSSYPEIYQKIIKNLPNRKPILAMDKLKQLLL
jgi:hypothetical protein